MNTISTSTNKKNAHADICYGFRCSKKSTEKIEVNAGTFGEITLYLCSVCATKFKHQEI